MGGGAEKFLTHAKKKDATILKKAKGHIKTAHDMGIGLGGWSGVQEGKRKPKKGGEKHEKKTLTKGGGGGHCENSIGMKPDGQNASRQRMEAGWFVAGARTGYTRKTS